MGDWVYISQITAIQANYCGHKKTYKTCSEVLWAFQNLGAHWANRLQFTITWRIKSSSCIPCLPSKEKSPNNGPGIPESTNCGREWRAADKAWENLGKEMVRRGDKVATEWGAGKVSKSFRGASYMGRLWGSYEPVPFFWSLGTRKRGLLHLPK